jgi:FKBP-type peptidyl-prolyl cis-trans isomerase
MKKTTISIAFASAVILSSCGSEEKKVTLDTTASKVGYGIGLDIGGNIREGGLDTVIDIDALAEGIRHSLDQSATYLMDPDAAKEFTRNFFMEQQEAERKSALAKFEINKQAGNAFLEENKAKDGVQVTESGLQYKIIKQGNGPQPKLEQRVKVHYKGTLIDGTVFDSSYERGEPVTFGVGQVIEGWSEALQLMKVGSKYELYIPQELAYGENVRPGGPIEPFSALLFEVELLGIE